MRQFVVFNGTIYPSDTANTASAAMERDANGDAFVSGLSAGAIPSAAPTTTGSFLSTAGALLAAGTTQTAAVSLTSAATFVQKLNAAGGAFTVTLPPAAASGNLMYLFVKTDTTANLPTIKGNASELINAANTFTGLTTPYSALLVWCDGTQWWASSLGAVPAHLLASGSAPGAAAGANAGTSPPSPVVVVGANDARGEITFGTGTSPAAGAMVAVTFNAAYAATPIVVICAKNSATALLAPYVSAISASGFTIDLATAPAASQGNSTYDVEYVVIG